MAHSCVSTSASALRFNSSSSPISSSSSSQPQNLSLPFSPLRPRKSVSRIQLNSPPKAIYSDDEFFPPRRDIWSTSNDVYARGREGPSPMVLERLSSSSSQLYQNRIIRCGGPVDDEMANIIVAQLLYLDAIDPNKDIVMYINSPGGSVTAGMAIFDIMRHIRPDVSTICAGIAASMGAFLLSAGTKGKRYSLPNSRIMIHEPSGGGQGVVDELLIQSLEMLHHRATLAAYLSHQTGQTYDRILQDTARGDFFMGPEEAKVYGLIDGVISNPLKLFYPLAATANQ